MTTLRAALSAVAAIVVALLGVGLVVAFRRINNSKATGLAAVVGGCLEGLVSPLSGFSLSRFLLCSSPPLGSVASRSESFCSGPRLQSFRRWDWASSLCSHTYGYMSEKGEAAKI